MTSAPRLHSWIADALHQQGSRARALDVAKQVWAQHETVLRDGDAFFTWQLDLHAAAAAMAADGKLLIDETGVWALPGAAPVRKAGWAEDEIASVVRGYLTLLESEHGGAPARRSQIVADLIAGTGRTPAQVEALLCNISAVVQEHDLIPLSHYRPRSNVPLGVRPAVAAALAALS
ncbi:hypothetical protein NODU109028_07395 [Nocardioides dubius]|uniref:Uncharacterized protein n=1 Tax=Nocardioides dubius TaxID=317019 RepID=A0ABN1TZK0_9ACTN